MLREIVGPTPSGWNLARLGDVTTKIGSGATPRGGKQAYVMHGISFIRSQNVLDHRMTRDGLVRIGAEAAKTLQGVKLLSGDVLLNITGDSVARCALVDEELLPARVSQHVAIIRPTPALNPGYLQKYLTHPIFKAFMLSLSDGATRPALTKAQIESFPVLVPPRPVQDEIAALGKAVDDKIRVNSLIDKTCAELSSALFARLVWDYELLSELPQAYELGSIGDLCERIGNGGTPKRMIEEYWKPGTMPWFKTGELSDGPLLCSEEWISEKGLAQSSCSVWPTGTVLVALYASPTVGRLGVLESDATFNQACSALLAKAGVGPYVLFETLKATRSRLQNIAVGAVQQNISQAVLRAHQVVIPSREAASRFHPAAEALHRKRVAALRENIALVGLRDRLLPKLVSGELRIKNGERLVSEAV
jgi:type I restriction enzyme S subunit